MAANLLLYFSDNQPRGPERLRGPTGGVLTEGKSGRPRPPQRPSQALSVVTQSSWHLKENVFLIDRQPFCQELFICVSHFLSHERIQTAT